MQVETGTALALSPSPGFHPVMEVDPGVELRHDVINTELLAVWFSVQLVESYGLLL